ncbi:MAG TPA: hypothetical protein VN281_13385 [Verrucomicrobiae bacterium]|nr:hypothetical protein [Verrucomicrobiae bacterium]
MKASWKWLPGALVLISFFSHQSRAAVFSTNSFSDAFVTTGPTGNFRGNNYGSAGALGVSAPGLPKGEFQSVLQFDVSGAVSAFNNQYGAGQWRIQSVTLQLTATAPNNPIFNTSSAGQFQVNWMQNNSWTEGTGTPNAPTNNGITYNTLHSTFVGPNDENLGTFAFNGATNGTASYTLNLAPGLVSGLISGGDVSLDMFAADTNISYLFDSRNLGTVGARPLLTIDAIPEPGFSLWSLVTLCFASRRLFFRRSSTARLVSGAPANGRRASERPRKP